MINPLTPLQCSAGRGYILRDAVLSLMEMLSRERIKTNSLVRRVDIVESKVTIINIEMLIKPASSRVEFRVELTTVVNCYYIFEGDF